MLYDLLIVSSHQKFPLAKGERTVKRSLIPTRKQWQHWTLPSKHTAIGAFLGAIGLALTIGFYFFPRASEPDRPNVKVFFTAWNTKSDFELERGGRSLLFVSIPVLNEPVDRLVFASALLRPINMGTKSLRDLRVITMASDSLWNPYLGIGEKLAVSPLSGTDGFRAEVQRVDDKWIATRRIPRLDPDGGAPCPLFFLLEIGASKHDGPKSYQAKGKMEIWVTGEDWSGVHHVIDIRCLSATSAEEFIAKCKATARALREEGYPDVRVMLASTGGKGFLPIEGKPTIVQASIDRFFSFGGARLRDLQ